MQPVSSDWLDLRTRLPFRPGQESESKELVKDQSAAVSMQPPYGAAHQPFQPQGLMSQQYLPFGGGHHLIRRLGIGGFGEVWESEAPGGVKAAVKILFRPIDHAAAQREWQALDLLKELRHPFLLQTQAYWVANERLYVVMELADGSLRDRVQECQNAGLAGIPSRELALYIRETAEALDFLHERNVQHRDIKPENILLLRRHAKVADCGLARALAGDSLVSVSGSGTPLYMAPEVWRGKMSRHSDQYSLAATYAELRLNRRLFAGKDFAQLLFDHLEQRPNLAPLPEVEQSVLLRALAKDPDQRFPSCTEFAKAIEHALTIAPSDGREAALGVSGNHGFSTIAPCYPT